MCPTCFTAFLAPASLGGGQEGGLVTLQARCWVYAVQWLRNGVQPSRTSNSRGYRLTVWVVSYVVCGLQHVPSINNDGGLDFGRACVVCNVRQATAKWP